MKMQRVCVRTKTDLFGQRLEHGNGENESHDVHDKKGNGDDLSEIGLLRVVEIRQTREKRVLQIGEHENEHGLHAEPGEGVREVNVEQARQVGLAVTRGRLGRGIVRSHGTEFTRFLEEEGGNDVEEKDKCDAEVDQGVVPEHRANDISENAEHSRDGLHPGESLGARLALRRKVGNDRARRVEADVDGQVEGEGDNNRGPKNLDAGELAQFAEERQCEQHERGSHAADENERTAPPAPEPHLVEGRLRRT